MINKLFYHVKFFSFCCRQYQKHFNKYPRQTSPFHRKGVSCNLLRREKVLHILDVSAQPYSVTVPILSKCFKLSRVAGFCQLKPAFAALSGLGLHPLALLADAKKIKHLLKSLDPVSAIREPYSLRKSGVRTLSDAHHTRGQSTVCHAM